MTTRQNEIVDKIMALLVEFTDGEKEQATPVSTVPAKPVEMITVKECCEAVNGLSEHTVRQLVAQNKIKYIRTGQGKRYKLNPTTVRKIYIVVQSIYLRALQQGFTRENPCQNVIIPKKKDSDKRYSLSEEETKRFIKLVSEITWDEDVKRIIFILLFTGMRIGECLGLSWEDINFEEKTIYIRHTLSRANGINYLDSPKAKSSIRILAMNATVEKLLTEQKSYTEELQDALGSKYSHPEMVFPSGEGNYRDRSSLNNKKTSLTFPPKRFMITVFSSTIVEQPCEAFSKNTVKSAKLR